LNLRAALRLRCPRCAEGRLFEGAFRMHAACPSCGLRFEREPGYFVGAMYFSYALALLAGAPVAFLLWRAGAGPFATGAAVTLWIAAVAPALYRRSRALWIHFDRAVDPPPGEGPPADGPGGRG
jgi:uncharacterized protein (DUF983 family)